MTSKSSRCYSPERCGRIVNMLIEQRNNYPSEYAVIKSIALKLAVALIPYVIGFASMNAMLAAVVEGGWASGAYRRNRYSVIKWL